MKSTANDPQVVTLTAPFQDEPKQGADIDPFGKLAGSTRRAGRGLARKLAFGLQLRRPTWRRPSTLRVEPSAQCPVLLIRAQRPEADELAKELHKVTSRLLATNVRHQDRRQARDSACSLDGKQILLQRDAGRSLQAAEATQQAQHQQTSASRPLVENGHLLGSQTRSLLLNKKQIAATTTTTTITTREPESASSVQQQSGYLSENNSNHHREAAINSLALELRVPPKPGGDQSANHKLATIATATIISATSNTTDYASSPCSSAAHSPLPPTTSTSTSASSSPRCSCSPSSPGSPGSSSGSSSLSNSEGSDHQLSRASSSPALASFGRKLAGQPTKGDHEGPQRAPVMDEALLVSSLLNRQRLLLNQPAQSYPNNTQIANLAEHHHNAAHFWTPAGAQASRYLRFLGGRHKRQTGQTLDTARHSVTFKRRHRKRLNFHMPEPLLRANVKLKLEDYDKALSILTSDIRYQLHLLLYTRVQSIWLLVTTIVCILIPILLANLESIVMLVLGSVWLMAQLIGLLVSSRLRSKLDLMLEKSVAQVNSFFVDHNLMLGVIHRGGLLSKAKLLIPMLYFDTSQCREQIESYISTDSRKEAADGSLILDYSKIDSPSTKPNSIAIAQSLAKKIILRYSQRWISYYDKQKLIFTDDQVPPRHLSTGKCLCQFIEEHFNGDNKTSPTLNQGSLINKTYARMNSNTDKMMQLVIDDHKLQTKFEAMPGEQVGQPKQIRALYGSKEPQLAIPSLSRLVSLKNRTEIDMKDSVYQPDVTKISSLNNNNDNISKLASNISSSIVVGHIQNKASPESGSKLSATSSPEVSLDMGGDSITRSDDLVKKLRLLLELKKDELKGIDSSLFSAMLYRSPPPFGGLLLADHRQIMSNKIQ